MGACSFDTTIRVPKSISDDDAFQSARDRALHNHGHGGYSGSLAEKYSAITIHRAKNKANAQRIANALMGGWNGTPPIYREEITSMIEDKHGSAGAIRYPIDKDTDGVLFFGVASS